MAAMPTDTGPRYPTTFPTLRVVPLPTTSKVGSTTMLISPSLSFIFISASSGEQIKATDLPEDLICAVGRTRSRLAATRHRYLSPERGAEFFSAEATSDLPLLTSVHLKLHHGQGEIRSIAECARVRAEDRPDLEAYSLAIPLGGPAEITSLSALGLLRGLTTLEQLAFYREPRATGDKMPSVPGGPCEGGGLYIPFAPHHIEDRPAFGWRGLMLDTSRNWYGLPAIRKILDTMSLVKLNVFHWHITDANSWPLDLKNRPELAAKGAYSGSQKYSEADIQDLTLYAAERGIDVFLEIDVPGHTAILANSHPELIASAYILPANPYSNQPPAGQLRFATDETIEWTKGLMSDMVELAGEGQYIGTGGDEVNERCMMADPVTVASLKKKRLTLDEALDKFIGEVHAPIHAAGKTAVVWQDVALSHGSMPSLSRDTVVHIWQGVGQSAGKALEKGFKVVHCPGLVFSLDGGQGSWMATPHGNDNVNSYKTWAKMMSYDPYACTRGMIGQEKHDKSRVLGGQASMWSEQTDETNIEQVLWPRVAGVADLYWTGDKVGGGYPRVPRMNDIRYRMVDRGVAAIPLMPHWCALRPETSVDGA